MLAAKENNGILVCANPQAMSSKALAYGITGFDIISYENYLNVSYDYTKKVYIYYSSNRSFFNLSDCFTLACFQICLRGMPVQVPAAPGLP